MKGIVDLCVVPIGVGVHLAPFIATCERVLSDAGLKIQLHPNGTAIEGEWEPVFQAVHAMGCPPGVHHGEDQHPHRQGPDLGGQGGQRAG